LIKNQVKIWSSMPQECSDSRKVNWALHKDDATAMGESMVEFELGAWHYCKLSGMAMTKLRAMTSCCESNRRSKQLD
jgi:hypothetical protein